MNENAVVFDRVSKSYPLYHHIIGGIKRFIFNIPAALKAIKTSRYEALSNISFEIKKGETVGVIGRNGAGKSTTLGLIAGVMKCTSGSITVNGRVAPLLELGAGFNHELTGRENIILNAVLLGLNISEVKERISSIIAFSELGDFIDQPIRVYSSGMLARLGFSVAAHLNFEILLVDEVLGVGDQQFQKKCYDKILESKQAGMTIVFVSHSMPEIEKVCGRVIWIENHTVKQIGETKQVIDAYIKAQENHG